MITVDFYHIYVFVQQITGKKYNIIVGFMVQLAPNLTESDTDASGFFFLYIYIIAVLTQQSWFTGTLF